MGGIAVGGLDVAVTSGMVRLECAEVVGGGGLGHVVFGEIRARERQRVERGA